MYDSRIGSKVFRRLKSEIAQLYYATNDVDVPELISDIQDAYSEGEISSTQYDNLIGELIELGYSL